MDYFKPFFIKIAGRARKGDHTSAHERDERGADRRAF